MRWAPFVDAEGQAFPLHHLHPFRYQLETTDGRTVEIRVAFAMHCFTRGGKVARDASNLYKDEREVRTFCHGRYALSSRLPLITRELETRKCGFAKHENYLTIDGGRATAWRFYLESPRREDERRSVSAHGFCWKAERISVCTKIVHDS